MKKHLVVLTLLAAMILAGADVFAQAKTDEIAVIVNAEPIYMWEIGLLLPQIEAEMASQGLEPKGRSVITTALQRAIESRLLAQEAKRSGIEPNLDRIDQKLRSLSDSAGGRAKLEVELIRSGVTYEQMRSTVVQADLVQSIVESEIGKEIVVTDEEIATFYAENPGLFQGQDKIHTRHILFEVEKDATPAQKKAVWDRAVAARDRALAGEDFAALAAELSEGPNAERGGDLGFTTRGQMIKSFDDAVWALDAGQISDVVESPVGYHVILVEEIVPGPTTSIEEARPAIEDILRQQKTGEAIGTLVAELNESAEIRNP